MAASRKPARPAARDGNALGAQLRAERDRLGLSLRELARRLDVSPSLVSQIETGKIQPSVRTLYAIVSELGVSMDSLFDVSPRAAPPPSANGTHRRPRPSRRPAIPEATGGGSVQRACERRILELESGVRWERLTSWDDPEVDFLYAVYAAGGESSPEGKLVRHDGRELGLVLRGRLGVSVGTDEHVLDPGDSISFESKVPHRLHNDGDEDVHAVWIVFGRHPRPSDAKAPSPEGPRTPSDPGGH